MAGPAACSGQGDLHSVRHQRAPVGWRDHATDAHPAGDLEAGQLAAALSFRTVYRPEGRDRPYDDATGADGLLRYKMRGTDPNHFENRALREAWRERLPLIWWQEFHAKRLMVLPTSNSQRPDRLLLEQRYQAFLDAS